MLESLTENIGKALRNLRGIGKLTDENMAQALDEVRKALLSADVHVQLPLHRRVFRSISYAS